MVLAVTATGREAEDLTEALRAFLPGRRRAGADVRDLSVGFPASPGTTGRWRSGIRPFGTTPAAGDDGIHFTGDTDGAGPPRQRGDDRWISS